MLQINITNSEETIEDIQFGYQKVTITDVTTGETLSFRSCSPLQETSDFVSAHVDNFFQTKEFEGKLLRFWPSIKESGVESTVARKISIA